MTKESVGCIRLKKVNFGINIKGPLLDVVLMQTNNYMPSELYLFVA